MTDQGHLNLPAVPDEGEVEELVFDGEVVEEDRAPGPTSPPAPVRGVVVLRPVMQVFQTVVVVVQAPPARAVARHAMYVPAGAVVLWRRRQRRRTMTQRMALQFAAQAATQDKALAVLQHAELERKQRHDRARGRVEVLVMLAKNIHWLTLAAVVLMLMLGMAVGNVAWPFEAAAAAVRDARLAAVWGLRLGPFAALAALYTAGRHAGDLAPGWSLAAKPGDEGRGLVVTADTIVLALQNIPVPELKAAFKGGWRPVFTLQPVRDGRGYESENSLPLGVTAEMIADRRPVLARNLHRDEIETWPSAGKPGYLRLWVADPGAIGKAAPEYPLLHEGQADVFEGVPGGVVARGDGALVPVVGNNGVLGGMMGQGKSNAARVFMLGCATDPLCGLDVFVFANNGDFDAYEPRLAVYRKGLDDDAIEAAVEHLHEFYADVAAREQMLADIGAKKVTRAVAEKYPELRPRVTLLSECHELFGHPEYGELAGDLAVKGAKRARKTGRVLLADTQSSRKSAIPPAFVELVSVNCCFAVKSWRSNDGFLGDGSFAAGIRATELRPGRDRGTSLVTGISDAQFELLKWYFVEVNDDTGYDAAAEVIARCMASVAPGTPVAANSPQPAMVLRDLIADVAEVAGPDRIRLADLPARLRKLAPSYGLYRSLTGVELRELLDDLGVRTTNPKNVPTLDPGDLRQALAGRGELAVPLSRMVPQGLGRGLDLTRLTSPPDLITAGHRAVSSGMAWVRNLTR